MTGKNLIEIMQKVELRTGDGSFVTAGYVPHPHLNEAPEVLFWGERCFRWYRREGYACVYLEASAAALVLNEQGQPFSSAGLGNDVKTTA